MAKLPPHIQRRDNRYYAVLNIPEPLRIHYPGASKGKFLYKLVQSLETENLSEAKRRVVPVVSAWKRQFSELRDEPTDDGVYFRRKLQQSKTDAERSRILAQVEIEAENLASPSMSHSSVDQPADYQRYKEAEENAHKQAQEFYDKATGQIVDFTDFIEDWLDRSPVTDKTKAMQCSDVKRFSKSFPTVQDVTLEGVQKWIDGLAVAPKTIKRILSALRGYWRHLQRSDVNVAPKDLQPFNNLELPKRNTNRKPVRKPFTKAQVNGLLIASRGDEKLANLIHMAMFTGCRIEELCSLQSMHVHLSADVPYIEIADAKTKAGQREVPIHRSLVRMLTSLVEESNDGYVLSGLPENKYGDRSNSISKRFGRLKTRLGMGAELVFHSIRKTVSTLLENAGVSENVAADILGHEKPRITYGLYSGGSSLEVKAKAIAKLSYGPRN